MEKYDTYDKEVRDDVVFQRIDLAKNYRSRGEVVEGVNSLFFRIMGRDLGIKGYNNVSKPVIKTDTPKMFLYKKRLPNKGIKTTN